MEIRRRLPHRYPFLLVDRILELEEGVRAVGLKNVTANEPFFNGHYPQQPIMPGVLIAEAMAQVGGLALSGAALDDSAELLPLFAGIDQMRFRRIVTPGDQLRIEAKVLKYRRGLAKVDATAWVAQDVVCQGELMFALKRADELSGS